MKLEEFDFDLPESLIAQHPADKRDESRLLILHKNTGTIEHKHFFDIINYLHKGDVLVRNVSKVIPARLYGIKEVGCNSVLNPGTVIGRESNIYPTSCVRGVIPEKSIYKDIEKR